ncbi:hypothetical protein ABPG77_001807 [Micractinium sp. CCAP 211/92]
MKAPAVVLVAALLIDAAALGAHVQPAQSHRRLLADPAEWSEPGGTYEPAGGAGSWESGSSTGIIMIHANLMKDGTVVGWSGRNQGLQEYGSVVYDPVNRTATQLLDRCGIHDCKNAFCAGHTVTAMSEVLVFGGHAQQLQWFRSYTHVNRTVKSTLMSSGRWYPGVATLPDGKVVAIGGVLDSGEAGYHAEDTPHYDNPSYEVYDPATGEWSGDQYDMEEQLTKAFPIHTYPHAVVLPDGGLAVSAGKLLVKYDRSGPLSFTKAYSYGSRPGPPWSYPQTGVGVPLPMLPPYDKVHFLAAGGSSKDRARVGTPASAKAHVVELTAGAEATWQEIGSMPHKRVMGDGVILCDGTIGILNGAADGIGGWVDKPQEVKFKDGSTWQCEEKCSKAAKPVYEPTLFDPETGKWSAMGSLSEAERPRLYHSVAVLMPDCTVLTAGSDVTWDQTAEIWRPPYLNKGEQLQIPYTSTDPIARSILIRNGAVTHSMSFDTRALWLTVSSDTNGTLSLAMPPNSNVVPPGLYMLVILTDKGVPSPAKILSVLPENGTLAE